MPPENQSDKKIKVGIKQAFGLIMPYASQRLIEQIKAVALIILYLIFFQTIVLGIGIAEATVIALGLSLVVVGLTFFMEGLLLGLMPLGEIIGIKMPQKSKLYVILIFAFILGVGATFAEPAIGVLKAAGASVKAWDAPLLHLLLNQYSDILVYAVGGGVGLAVVFGTLRFMYNWSLKPFIYLLVTILTAVTVWGFFDDNLIQLAGLAWDCGAVTTGPVTVPLVLALGIGISRVVGGSDSGGGGFGVVTLASLFPIVTVMVLGILFLGSVPSPMKTTEFFSSANRQKALFLFPSPIAMKGYALTNSNFNTEDAPEQPIESFLGVDKSQTIRKQPDLVAAYLLKLKADEKLAEKTLGSKTALTEWVLLKGNNEQRLAFFGNKEKVNAAAEKYSKGPGDKIEIPDLLSRNAVMAFRAIIPLCLFMMFVLVFIVREKMPRVDEISFGILFALLGMGIFNIGIELGLTKLGNQIGSKLPSSFTTIELPESKKTLSDFDTSVVKEAITSTGEKEKFFYTKVDNEYVANPYDERNFDPVTKQLSYTPTRGPLFGANMGITGILVVLLFAFIMGYGATLAEPALNALGLTVEEITVGTFKKSLLMQAVAIGVGIGISLGVAKIIWNIPLVYLLTPPYLLLLFVSKISTEEFVNIGWDSAGVTTGPITVPLVLAMGLGIGGQVPGVVEGFGILSMASVSPILAVLLVGLNVTKKRQQALAEATKGDDQKVGV